MNTTNTAIGTLVARTEAPTVLYRVTSRHPGCVRVLPYRRSGEAKILASMGGMLIGDGSQWTVAQGSK